MRHISRYVSRHWMATLKEQIRKLCDVGTNVEVRYTVYPDLIHIEISYEAPISYADLFDEAQWAA